mmetsp:Transcript_51515/g.81727  ORF Transcript_51515/g.81727 Transcript_51515/m.81727 type:complete len:92 (+) Transcript_51515:1035-1310(+)
MTLTSLNLRRLTVALQNVVPTRGAKVLIMVLEIQYEESVGFPQQIALQPLTAILTGGRSMTITNWPPCQQEVRRHMLGPWLMKCPQIPAPN